jgi:hypothetical protein
LIVKLKSGQHVLRGTSREFPNTRTNRRAFGNIMAKVSIPMAHQIAWPIARSIGLAPLGESTGEATLCEKHRWCFLGQVNIATRHSELFGGRMCFFV